MDCGSGSGSDRMFTLLARGKRGEKKLREKACEGERERERK